ncbi:MAG TPA: SRPBCC domain-containing protein [Caulobacteraceae bacterium]|nr:SRPBCC domain-containing protein [Caulobacteraceae bacterium]
MTSLTLVRRIAARPSIVFEALTTAEGIAAWWGPDELPVLSAELDARVGGAYRVRFQTLDGQEHEAFGEYLEVDPPRRVAMSWNYAFGGEPAEAGRTSRIEFDVRPIDGGAELTLTHTRLADEASRASHARGWTGSLAKLVGRLGALTAPAQAPTDPQ